MSPSLSSTSMAYTHYPSPSAPTPAHHASTSPLAAIYASYVVRVHTRHGIKTLSFDHLAVFFTLTAKKAAEDLGISSRTLIRVCRSLGIRRWPYLGFRSEKNVERIRQEAIENLRRKLEKDGVANPTTVLHPNSSSLRGASAKRLLQVKLPQGSMSPMPNSHMHHMSSPTDSQTWSVQSIDDTESEDDTDFEMVEARVSPMNSTAPRCHQSLPLLTPQPMQHGFNLEVRSISPKKPLLAVHGAPAHLQRGDAWMPKVTPAQMSQPVSMPNRPLGRFQPHQQQQLPQLTKPSGVMPSLNLLVDASILTAFKHDSSSQFTVAALPQQPRCPRMSMRDILSHTAMAA